MPARTGSCYGFLLAVNYQMMKRFFRIGFASGRRLRIPASGYERRNEKVSLTVDGRAVFN